MIAKRAAFVEEMAKIDPVRLVFIDEMGSNITLAHRTAWGPVGERVVGKRPACRGKNVTVIAALVLGGMVAWQAMEGALNGSRFVEWVQNNLARELQPGDVVVLDNLRVHKDRDAIALIEARGARVLFLPPYSPDLNPIELAWSKIKGRLRSIAARTLESLFQAIPSAIAGATRDDAIGWFAHAGWGHA